MKCVICNQAETRPGKITVTLERGRSSVVVKNVPVQGCPNCGETFSDEQTARRLLSVAEEMAAAGVLAAVRPYEAA